MTCSIIIKPPSSPTRSTTSVAPVGWSIVSAPSDPAAPPGSDVGVPADAAVPASEEPGAPPQATSMVARTIPATTDGERRARRTAGRRMPAGTPTRGSGFRRDACHNRGMARDTNRPLREAWIVGAVRTPIGRYGGALASVRPDDLAAVVLRAIVDRTGIDPALIEDVILGCANQAGEDNRNVARMAALLAGLPVEVAGQTVNRLCGSGLQAVNAAAHALAAGDGEVFIAGGVESMSRAPYVLLKPETAYDRGARTMEDTTLGWRFVNPRMQDVYPPISLGQTA